MARPIKKDMEYLVKRRGKPDGDSRNERSHVMPYEGKDGRWDVGAAGLPQGRWTARGVYRIESEVAYGSSYGSHIFRNPQNHALLLKPWGAHSTSVFIDLETTGLSGGTGTYAFLAGLGICGSESFKIIQLFLSDPGCESEWLSALEAELPEDLGFVTYNGACFDIPLLRTRYTLARRTPVWKAAPHMDLLLLARHFYRKRLTSCSLSSVESHILGVQRSGDDIQGRDIPAVYADFLRTRDAACLRGVFYHNRLDIVSLAALTMKVAALLAGEGCSGEDWLRCGDLWYIMGRGKEAQAAWQRAMEQEDGVCGANLRFADSSRRNGDFESAKRHFEVALRYEKHPFEILENLAKLEEHRFQNYEAALDYAKRALSWLDSRRSLRDCKWSLQRREVIHRIERLERKIMNRGA